MLDTLRTIGAAMIGLAVLVAILNPVFAFANDTSEPIEYAEDALFGDSNTAELSHTGQVENLSVQQTLGTAIRFGPADDSSLIGSADIQHDDTWTVSTWVRVNGSVDTANASMRVMQLGEWFYLDYAEGEWRVVHYDDVGLNTVELTVPADSPTTNTHIVVTRNESDLTVFTNSTVAGSTTITDGSSADVNITETRSFYGSTEETRVYDDVVTDSQRDSLYLSPVSPVRANETARIYYDVRDGEASVDVYRTGADLAFSNVTVIDGFSGTELEPDGLLNNGDYRLSGTTLVAVDGGELDGAPVAFVDYLGNGGPFSSLLVSLQSTGGAALGLLVIGLLIYAANRVMGLFGGSGF